MQEFRQWLKAERKAKGQSQYDSADKCGVAQMTWSCWERGVNTPRVPQLLTVAKWAGVTLEELAKRITAQLKKKGA